MADNKVAFDMLAKKAGHPVDRNTGEKITDGIRGAFEKATGYGISLPRYIYTGATAFANLTAESTFLRSSRTKRIMEARHVRSRWFCVYW
jgi:hypothetical protein